MKDGEVEDYELKNMLMLDDGLPERYKNEKYLSKLINLINEPISPKSVKVKNESLSKKEKAKLYEDFITLYNKGLKDMEISDELDINYHKIRYMRMQAGLISNNFKVQKNNLIKVKSLYEKGHSDYEIAKEVKLSQTAIFKWREKNKLPPNNEPVGGRKKND